MKKVLGAFAILIVIVILAVVAVLVFSNTSAGPVSDVANSAKVAATNAAIDASGVKEKVTNALETHRDTIAAAMGMTQAQIDEAIASLDINSWTAITLPANAIETGSTSANYAGIDGVITTYQDPSYISFQAYGQTATLAVPEGAQEYIPYLSMIK